MILAVYLQELTKSGNGCVWYLVTLILDVCLGTFVAYICFKIVDETAIRLGIEVLKSGLYTDKDVPVDDDDVDPDDFVNLKTWFIQLVVWCICQFIAKIFVFFVQFAYHKDLYAFGSSLLIVFKGHPKMELIVVMIFVPFLFNSIMFWIQDAFLKGDKHLDARKAEQEAERRRLREERCNMGAGNRKVEAAGE